MNRHMLRSRRLAKRIERERGASLAEYILLYAPDSNESTASDSGNGTA
jgi:hypothetical protein